MYADILAEELSVLPGDTERALHIVPARRHAFGLLKDWKVVDRIKGKRIGIGLDEVRITVAADIPIFPYATASSQQVVVESWMKALETQ